MSYSLAIYFFLKLEFQKDSNKWFSVRDVASTVNLSIDRTRKHLTILVFDGELDTHVQGWKNVYRLKGQTVASAPYIKEGTSCKLMEGDF